MEGVGFRAFRVEGLGEGRGGVRTLNLKSLESGSLRNPFLQAVRNTLNPKPLKPECFRH